MSREAANEEAIDVDTTKDSLIISEGIKEAMSSSNGVETKEVMEIKATSEARGIMAVKAMETSMISNGTKVLAGSTSTAASTTKEDGTIKVGDMAKDGDYNIT